MEREIVRFDDFSGGDFGPASPDNTAPNRTIKQSEGSPSYYDSTPSNMVTSSNIIPYDRGDLWGVRPGVLRATMNPAGGATTLGVGWDLVTAWASRVGFAYALFRSTGVPPFSLLALNYEPTLAIGGTSLVYYAGTQASRNFIFDHDAFVVSTAVGTPVQWGGIADGGSNALFGVMVPTSNSVTSYAGPSGTTSTAMQVVWKDRAVAVESGVGRIKVWYSAAGDYTTWPAANFLVIDSTDAAAGVIPVGDFLYIFGTRATYVITGTFGTGTAAGTATVRIAQARGVRSDAAGLSVAQLQNGRVVGTTESTATVHTLEQWNGSTWTPWASITPVVPPIGGTGNEPPVARLTPTRRGLLASNRSSFYSSTQKAALLEQDSGAAWPITFDTTGSGYYAPRIWCGTRAHDQTPDSTVAANDHLFAVSDGGAQVSGFYSWKWDPLSTSSVYARDAGTNVVTGSLTTSRYRHPQGYLVRPRRVTVIGVGLAAADADPGRALTLTTVDAHGATGTSQVRTGLPVGRFQLDFGVGEQGFTEAFRIQLSAMQLVAIREINVQVDVSQRRY